MLAPMVRIFALALLLVLTRCGQSASPAAQAGAPSAAEASGKRAPCSFGADQTCNEDPAVSSFWGHCTELGVCECKPGFELATSGYCRPAQ